MGQMLKIADERFYLEKLPDRRLACCNSWSRLVIKQNEKWW